MGVCDDLINRQAAIDVFSVGKELLSRVLDDMNVVGADREKYSWGLGLIDSYINDIEELPSVQITDARENVHGNWLYCEKYDDYKCSACGQHSLGRYNFCPDCGARMEE